MESEKLFEEYQKAYKQYNRVYSEERKRLQKLPEYKKIKDEIDFKESLKTC